MVYLEEVQNTTVDMDKASSNKREKSYSAFSLIRGQQLPLPPDLTRPKDFMDDYLSTLKDSNYKSERKIVSCKKAVATRRHNQAIQQQKKITVTPLTKDSKPLTKNENKAAEGNSRFVKETRTGIRVICDHCGHSFVHFSKNLYSQFCCTCSRCHLNVRLKHYKNG